MYFSIIVQWYLRQSLDHISDLPVDLLHTLIIEVSLGEVLSRSLHAWAINIMQGTLCGSIEAQAAHTAQRQAGAANCPW